eukprot:TRINITY_DN2454_c0_g1_i1.p2 TRINITY_DN2454_c0_g1~~TRINITY_DN2454_c0_g1_i1.p2  ORF type:complete len:376 (+),score=129.84 TRINITY_DN2454_c0_g1_i1:41-1168(+)
MILQRLGRLSTQTCASKGKDARFALNSSFIRHKSMRVKKKLVLQDDPVPSWYKGPRIGDFASHEVRQVEAEQSTLNVKLLGKLPRGRSQVNNTFLVNGVPWIVHYADLFKLDTKTWQFEKVPYTGNLIPSEQAVYDKKTNKVFFSRDLSIQDITQISNILTLDMSNMHVSQMPAPEEYLRSRIALTEKGKLLIFGQEPLNVVKELYMTFKEWKDGKWESIIVDSSRYSPPASRFSWVTQVIGDTIHIFAHSGRRKEEALLWKYNGETTKMEHPTLAGVAPVYHEKSAALRFVIDGKNKIGLYGGKRERGGGMNPNINLLDVDSLSWDPIPNVVGDEMKARHSHRILNLNDKEALVFGGMDQEGNHFDEFFLVSAK